MSKNIFFTVLGGMYLALGWTAKIANAPLGAMLAFSVALLMFGIAIYWGWKGE
jgi:hypothetical protein